MQKNTRHVIAGLLLSLPLLAWASGTAVLKADNETLHISWQGTKTLRMQSADTRDYMLLREGKVYSVGYEGKQPVVLELSQMMQGFAAGVREDPAFQRMAPQSLTATGRTETVAGIPGKVYEATIVDADGRTQNSDMVLTDDARVIELSQAYLYTVAAMFGSDDVRKAYEDSLPAGARGILRVGSEWSLQSISDVAPPPSDFELPAAPAGLPAGMPNMQQLQEMMKQMQQQNR